MTTDRVWTQAEVLALARLNDAGGFSPLSQPPFLLFRAEPAKPAAARALAAWLRELPCPVVCLNEARGASPVVKAADVVARSIDELPPLLAGIRRSPIAAATF